MLELNDLAIAIARARGEGVAGLQFREEDINQGDIRVISRYVEAEISYPEEFWNVFLMEKGVVVFQCQVRH